MMDKYASDVREIVAILNAMFIHARGSNKTGAQSALDNITMSIGNSFLDGRAAQIKNLACESSEVLSKLGLLYEVFCITKRCEECSVRKYCNAYIDNKISSYDKTAPVMIDLFCGAGGLSLGFSQEGFITSLANDIEPCCIDTYAHNHPDTPRENIILGDIRDVVQNIDTLLRFKAIDVVVGGPPCQGFSMANRQRLIDDPRNKLYKNYVEVVRLTRPKFFVMENVKGMKKVANQVITDFANIGYRVSVKLLNAKDFSVPQNRERLIFIGNRLGIDNDNIFTELEQVGESLPKFVLKDALFGLRPLEAMRAKNSTEIDTEKSGRRIERATTAINDYTRLINQDKIVPLAFNHKARYNNDRDIEIFGRLYQGDKSDDPKIADIMPYKRRNGIFKDKYFKLQEDNVCKTITAHMKFDCNMYIHPTQARGLTPREAARVQSYPDDYFFRGAFTKTYMQIGNSVPPLLGRAIASVVKKYLTKDSE